MCRCKRSHHFARKLALSVITIFPSYSSGFLILLAGALFTACFTNSLHAQSSPPVLDNIPTPASPLGVPPNASTAGTNEVVSPSNGSLNVYIPVLSLPQRGGYPLSIGLVHHSNAFSLYQTEDIQTSIQNNQDVDQITYHDTMATSETPLSVPLPALTFSYEYVGDYPERGSDGVLTGALPIFCATNFLFTDWYGNKHPFENLTYCSWHLAAGNSTVANVTDSSDGSFYRLDTSKDSDLQVTSKDGTLYHFYGFSNPYPQADQTPTSGQHQVYGYLAALIVDPNGNQITIANGSTATTITDTLGRTITLNQAGISYSDSNGAPQSVILTTTASQTKVDYTFPEFACQYPYANPQMSTTTAKFSQIPSSTTTTVQFPPSAGSGSKRYTLTFDAINRLTKIVYPSGGYTGYDYNDAVYQNTVTQIMGNVQCTFTLDEVLHKYECSNSNGSCTSPQTTTYSAITTSSLTSNYNASMTITNPLGETEQHTFSITSPYRTNPQETGIYMADSSGNIVRKIEKTYPPPPTGSFKYNLDIVFPSSVKTTTYNGGTSVVNTTSYQYQAFNAKGAEESEIPFVIDNPTEIDDTDYNGTTIRKISQQWEDASSFTSATHILDRLESRSETDATASMSVTTDYGYDTSGNVLSITKQGTSAGPYTTSFIRNSYGQVTKITDARGNDTTIGYGDAWADPGQSCIAANSSAYPTTVTNALQQATAYTYNACTGSVASITDPNAAVTAFTYDALGRVLCKSVNGVNNNSSVMLAKTCDVYGDSAPEAIAETVTAPHSIQTTSLLDGFGRVGKTSETSYPGGPLQTDFTYDALGRKQSASNPYVATGEATYGITSYSYDALGRPVMQMPA